MATTNGALLRKRLSMNSGVRAAAAPAAGCGSGLPASPDGCALLDITAAASNQEWEGAMAAADSCHALPHHERQRVKGPSPPGEAPPAPAVETSLAGNSKDGWDGDDDDAPNWDLLGDLDAVLQQPQHPPAAAKQRPEPAAAGPAAGQADVAQEQQRAAQQGWGSSPDEAQQAAAAAREPDMWQRLPDPYIDGSVGGRGSAARRTARAPTVRRRRLRSILADEEEEGEGEGLAAGRLDASFTPAGPLDASDNDADLYDVPWSNRGKAATAGAPQQQQKQQEAPAEVGGLRRLRKAGSGHPVQQQRQPVMRMMQAAAAAAGANGDLDPVPAAAPLSSSRVPPSLQRISLLAAADGAAGDVEPGAAAAAAGAAAAKPKGNPFARTGAAAKSSCITLAPSAAVAVPPTATAAAAKAADAVAKLASLPEAPPGSASAVAKPWQQHRTFKPPRIGFQQQQRIARVEVALDSSSDDDFQEAPSTAKHRPSTSGQEQQQAQWQRVQLNVAGTAQQLRRQQQQRQQQQQGGCKEAPREQQHYSSCPTLLAGQEQVFWEAPDAEEGGLKAQQQPQQQAWGAQQQRGSYRQQQPEWHGNHQQEQPWEQHDGGRQQQQQQQLKPFWQAPDDEDGGGYGGGGTAPYAQQWADPMHTAEGDGGPAWQPAGPAADGGVAGGKAPWWARFPDFVPVAALQGGKDPRDGSLVYVDYRQQFSGATSGGATAASKAVAGAGPFGAGGGGSSGRKRSVGGRKGDRAGSSGGQQIGYWQSEGGKNVYIDTRGRKLWGQQAWLAAKKEKGEPLNTRGGSRGVVRKRKSSSGGHHKRKSGGGKRAKK